MVILLMLLIVDITALRKAANGMEDSKGKNSKNRFAEEGAQNFVPEAKTTSLTLRQDFSYAVVFITK